jgi:hypothetical protein
MTLRASVQVRVLTVSAALDPANKNPFASETLLVLDQKVLQTFKALLDTASPVDTQFKEVSKRPTEVVVVGDVLGKLIDRFIGSVDTASVSDNDVISFIKAAFDQVVAIDQLQRSLGKSLSDAVGMNDEADIGDGFEFQFAKAFANVAGVSEAKVFAMIKSLADTAQVIDTPALSFERPVDGDSVGVDDASSFNLGTAKIDSITLDSLATLASDLGKFEFISAEDVLGLDVGKFLDEDLVLPDESLAYDIAKQLTDTYSVEDLAALSVERPVEDEFSTESAVSLEPELSKDDEVSSDDYLNYEVGKFFENDATSFTDAIVLAYGVDLFDGFGVNDAVGPGDGVEFLFERSVANVAFVSDFSARLVGKNLGESVSATEAGSLISQGYCDLSYFAEDFVGATRTF